MIYVVYDLHAIDMSPGSFDVVDDDDADVDGYGAHDDVDSDAV